MNCFPYLSARIILLYVFAYRSEWTYVFISLERYLGVELLG
jgi:hypothetical protein